MLAVLLVLLAQIPCEGIESSVVCYCKQGVATACEALRQTNVELANRLEAAAQAAATLEAAHKAAKEVKAEGESSPASPEPPECKGQEHHIISRPIAKELGEHLTLRGLYKPRDPRFVTRAVDEAAHCGYQDWHRKVDEEVIEWLQSHRKATAEQFETFLREIYSRPEMLKRFPHGF
ncbi:Wall-associated protein precursor [Vitiosangium sp. GDMCC 1.1324]|uniref:Wall-associated protein precursor n=1 Tax=Vitiosangium sp. (strain GDMCC 1.1324) TaxID=2138576 RepID=UPI000D3ABB6A|nr:Wall-associated protein precursor [Vitiosangium sp. GDMCC 1.1324]PTL79059.1 Wall-associated protein precursor [Vitiosangium sp. GDMCC 1.1324]